MNQKVLWMLVQNFVQAILNFEFQSYVFKFPNSTRHLIIMALNFLIAVAQFGKNWFQAGCKGSKHDRDADYSLSLPNEASEQIAC